MLRAHRQAWCWQDEYHGLQLADIRKLELETQLALQEKMAGASENDNFVDGTDSSSKPSTSQKNENLNAVKTDTNESIVNNKSSAAVQKSRSLDHVMSKKVHQGRQSPALSVSSNHSVKSKSKQLSRSKTSLGKGLDIKYMYIIHFISVLRQKCMYPEICFLKCFKFVSLFYHS